MNGFLNERERERRKGGEGGDERQEKEKGGREKDTKERENQERGKLERAKRGEKKEKRSFLLLREILKDFHLLLLLSSVSLC